MSHYNQSSDFEGNPSEVFQRTLKNIHNRFSEYGNSLKEKDMSLQIGISGSFSWTWDVSEKKMSMNSILDMKNLFLNKDGNHIKEIRISFPFTSHKLQEKEFICTLMDTIFEKLLESINKK